MHLRLQLFLVDIEPSQSMTWSMSLLTLGAQNIGDQWHSIEMGAMRKESSFKLLDAFFNAGGNPIDTANP